VILLESEIGSIAVHWAAMSIEIKCEFLKKSAQPDSKRLPNTIMGPCKKDTKVAMLVAALISSRNVRGQIGVSGE